MWVGLVIRCVSFGNCCDSYDEFCGDGDDGGGGGGGLGAGAIVRSNERERGEGEYIYIYMCVHVCFDHACEKAENKTKNQLLPIPRPGPVQLQQE